MKTQCCLLSQHCGQASIVHHEWQLSKHESLIAGPDVCCCDLFDLAFELIEMKLVEFDYSECRGLLNQRNQILVGEVELFLDVVEPECPLGLNCLENLL